MLRKLVLLAVAAGIVGFAIFWFVTIPATVPASALTPHTPNIENGRTMFYASGCASCHTTIGQDDRLKLGGGHPLHSPFGTFYAPNISPDPKMGIGSWTEQQFVDAMLKGTTPGGSHYFPAFPYTSYRLMPVSDVRDLFAFMKTLPAVQDASRPHDVPFPFNVRRSLGGWKLLFFDDKPFQPDPTKSERWNRGAYLVNGPGHCAECHSPRNLLGGIVTSQKFAGGPNPEGKGWVPNITQAGLKDWTVDDIEYLLETGNTPEGDTVGSNMAPVIRNTAQLSKDDRLAMAEYLKSLPAVEGPRRPSK
ncbi:c-type cytochrome [Pseudorhodoplanes sp.]|uniref:c-type cytochrome n=1 Tax=Pseudorhodoplanes sp. TaxID=1934341 RepID=UPI00391B6B11